MHINAEVNSNLDSSYLVRCKTKKIPLKFNGKARSIYDPLRIDLNQDGHRDRFLTTVPSQPTLQIGGISWSDLGLSFLVGTDFSVAAVLSGVCSIDHARHHFFRRNRMNTPAILLPAILNTASIDEAVKSFEDKREQTDGLALEPFLVLPDGVALQRWQERKLSRKHDKNIFDEMPGFWWGIGTIKLSDSYDGPAMTVVRAP